MLQVNNMRQSSDEVDPPWCANRQISVVGHCLFVRAHESNRLTRHDTRHVVIVEDRLFGVADDRSRRVDPSDHSNRLSHVRVSNDLRVVFHCVPHLHYTHGPSDLIRLSPYLDCKDT